MLRLAMGARCKFLVMLVLVTAFIGASFGNWAADAANGASSKPIELDHAGKLHQELPAQDKIVGGTFVSHVHPLHEADFIALIQIIYRPTDGTVRSKTCTGTLVKASRVLMSATCIPNLRQTLDPNLPNGVVITAVEVTIGAYRVKGGVAAIGFGRMATNVVGHPARFVSASSEAVWCPKYWVEDRLTKWAICIINLPQKVLGIEPAILANATDLMPRLGSPAVIYGWGAQEYPQGSNPTQLKWAAVPTSNCSTPLSPNPTERWLHSQQPCFICTDIPAIVTADNAGALCYGDHGAPLIVRDAESGMLKVFGVFSFTAFQQGPNGHFCKASLPEGMEKNIFVNLVAGEVAEWIELTLQES